MAPGDKQCMADGKTRNAHALQQGTTDLLIKNLPGYPDGISRSSDGNFWLTLLAPPVKAVIKAAPYKLARWLLAWLPDRLRPKVPEWGVVIKVCCPFKIESSQSLVQAQLRHTTQTTLTPVLLHQVSPTGEVLQMMMDPDGSYITHISSATEHQGRLYFGNLVKDYVSYLTIPEAHGASV